jgi:hypothetical protein
MIVGRVFLVLFLLPDRSTPPDLHVVWVGGVTWPRVFGVLISESVS